MKILISLFLFLPYFTFSFIVDVPYAKTQICEKIDSDYSKASVKLFKTITSFAGGLNHSQSIKGYNDFTKVHAEISKIFSDGLKYKCFKEAPDCIQSVKALSESHTDSSKLFAELSNTLAKIGDDSPKEMLVVLDKALDAQDKALDASDKAADNMKKYCSDGAKPQGLKAKIKNLFKNLKELFIFLKKTREK